MLKTEFLNTEKIRMVNNVIAVSIVVRYFRKHLIQLWRTRIVRLRNGINISKL